MAALAPASDRPKPCRFFGSARGCKIGDACKFVHADAPAKHADPVAKPAAGTALRDRSNDNGASKKKAGKPAAPSPQQQQQQQTESGAKPKPKRARGRKNTESFTPDHTAPAMRLVVDMGAERCSTKLQVRDVTIHPNLFNRPGDEGFYAKLVSEIEGCGVPEEKLLKSWHGDSHWIADDKTGWKKGCPTFLEVIARIQHYFRMDIKATRFNWYKDTSEWKPFHHDAAAVKPDKAKTQNFTVAVSFGATRDVAFEEVGSKTVISVPCPDRSVYCFTRDVNIMWKHGILQVPPEQQTNDGRISVIAWGWVDQAEVGPRPPPVHGDYV